MSPSFASSRSRFLTAVVVLCVAAASVALSAAPVSAVTGGRIAFTSPLPWFDSRTGVPLTEFALPGGSILQAWIIPLPGTAGTATVHPCASPVLTGEASFVFADGMVDYGRIVTDTTPMCLTATTPVHLVLDILGSIAPTPTAGRLQYVATTPEVVFDATLTGDATHSDTLARGNIPADAAAVALEIDVPAPTKPGYSTAFTCGAARPPVADLAYGSGRSTGIAYVLLNSPTAQACLFGSTAEQAKVTLVGYFTADGASPTSLPPTVTYTTGSISPPGLRPITPSRLLDTRIGLGRTGTTPVPAGGVVTLDLAGKVGTGSTAVVLNVTIVNPAGPGYVTVYPCDRGRPKASNLNYTSGQIVPNLVVAKLSLTRTVCIYTVAAAHLVADLSGTFETDGGSRARPVTPERLLDTRIPIGVETAGPLVAGGTLTLHIAGRGGVPTTSAQAVTLNVTVTEPAADGFLTVYPCDAERPVVSNLNYTRAQTVPNLVTVKLSTAGTVCLYTMAATHVVADIAQWYATSESVGFRDLTPERILDTRDATGIATTTPIPALGRVVLHVAGHGGVPTTGAVAVALNVTVTEPNGPGFVTVWPCDRDLPVVSNLNYVAGQTVPNAVTVKLAADGTVCLLTTATAHLVADVNGYFTTDPDLGYIPTIT